jgi:uncharacterized membrane protein
MDKKLLIRSALASMLVLSAVSAAQAANREQCYGIAMAGNNDCKAGNHNCAGQATVNKDPQSFKLVPAGSCVIQYGGATKPAS